MKIKAYGKINLALNIKGRRSDGYHELESVMLPLCFGDEIVIEQSEIPDYSSNVDGLVFDEHNTIIKALDLMKKEFKITDEFKIVLNKKIPMQAGLAGGSTDGAAIIRALNIMYDLKLNDEQIKELCLKIGADVLFTYYQRPALVEGLGDKLTFIDLESDYFVLLLKPIKGVSTKDCYNLFDKEDGLHPDIKEITRRLMNDDDFNELLGNSLEKTAIDLCPEILEAEELLKDNGADVVLLSGSGSTVFTISRSYEKLLFIYQKIKDKGLFVKLTRVFK